MRSASFGELGLLARVLVLAQPRDRRRMALQILAEVDAAAMHLRVTGNCHPCYGDGSLMARCLALAPQAEPASTDPAFLSAVIIACKALRQHSRL